MLSILQRIGRVLKCAVVHWSQDNSATTGASLAFYCAFSLAPLLIILLTVSGWVIGAEAAYGQLQAQLTSLFGSATATTLLEAMQKSQTNEGGLAAIISI